MLGRQRQDWVCYAEPRWDRVFEEMPGTLGIALGGWSDGRPTIFTPRQSRDVSLPPPHPHSHERSMMLRPVAREGKDRGGGKAVGVGCSGRTKTQIQNPEDFLVWVS